MRTQNPEIIVEEGQKLIKVPHEGKLIKFVYPAFGPNDYQSVGKQILEGGLAVPTGDQLASLFYVAYCSELKDNPEFNIENKGSIRYIMLNSEGIWNHNHQLWTSKGLYVVQDSKALGLNQELKVDDLEERLNGGNKINGVLFSKDRKVRFAPRETYENGIIIANFGEEGSEKLTEVFKSLPDGHDIYKESMWKDREPQQRISGFYEYFRHEMIIFDCNEFGKHKGDSGKFAFGIKK